MTTSIFPTTCAGPASQRLVTLNNCLRLYLGFTEHLWIARDLYGNNT